MPLPDQESGDSGGYGGPVGPRKTPPAVNPVDEDRPWLGLESFHEETRRFFFGRAGEIDRLHLLLRAQPLLVLYSRSGLGKTSILRAGLLVRLEEGEKKQRPAFARLRYAEDAWTPAQQFHFLLFHDRKEPDWLGDGMQTQRARQWWEELCAAHLFALPGDWFSRLWFRLHAHAAPPAITHLVLDQFEEVFTHGARLPGAAEEVRDALATLLQGAIPPPVSRALAEHGELLDHFDPDSRPPDFAPELRGSVLLNQDGQVGVAEKGARLLVPHDSGTASVMDAATLWPVLSRHPFASVRFYSQLDPLGRRLSAVLPGEWAGRDSQHVPAWVPELYQWLLPDGVPVELAQPPHGASLEPQPSPDRGWMARPLPEGRVEIGRNEGGYEMWRLILPGEEANRVGWEEEGRTLWIGYGKKWTRRIAWNPPQTADQTMRIFATYLGGKRFTEDGSLVDLDPQTQAGWKKVLEAAQPTEPAWRELKDWWLAGRPGVRKK